MSDLNDNVMYEIPIDIEPDNIIILNDIIRMTTIQVVAHLLFSITDSSVNFFNTLFIKTLIFIIIGVATYWLFIKKIIKFKSVIDDNIRVKIDKEYADIF